MSARSAEKQFLAKVPAALAALLDIPEGQVKAQRHAENRGMVLSAAGQTFVVEALAAAPAGAVALHAERVAKATKALRKRAVPLMVVPFMTEAGRLACDAAEVSWFDLSGNAHIVASGLRVIVGGQPNQFPARGRPSSVFAPKSARVARWLLMNPDRPFTQRELARSTDMREGFVSRIVARLEAEGYVTRVGVDGGGPNAGHRGKAPVHVRDPDLLLDAWKQEYRFSSHTIIKGHVAARSGDALARFVSDTFIQRKIDHAATGLAAAWQLTHFAAFRIATFFVTDEPSAGLKQSLGFREDSRGANLWLVVPNDAGVFLGAEQRDGLRCVHPVQAWLDLKEHPERSAEAAQRLRSDFMKWKRDA
jgi:hypothetical protein